MKKPACPPTGQITSTTSVNPLISHPVHYTKGIECWDYIVSHNLGFLEGNIVKYITRYEAKNGLEDLYKARQYLTKLISEVEKRSGRT